MEIENYTQQLFEILDRIEPKIKKICKPKNNIHQKAFKTRITEKRKRLIETLIELSDFSIETSNTEV